MIALILFALMVPPEWPAPLPTGDALRQMIEDACPGATLLGEREPDPRTQDETCKARQRQAHRRLWMRETNTAARRKARIDCRARWVPSLERWNYCEGG